MRVAQFILFVFCVASSTVFANLQYNMTPGVTPLSHTIYHLHMTIFWICVVIGIIVFSVMIYSILFHRKSKGAKAAHFHEHLSLEITWTLIPLVILIIMAIPATRALIQISDDSNPDITIKVTGFQWKWKYEYVDQGISFFSNNATPIQQIQNLAPKDANYLQTVDHPLVVPIHKKIRFLFTSNDVIHAWYVPDLGIQRDAIPGFINENWAQINRAGVYHGQCNKLCGINHAYMPIVINAVTEKEFSDWVTVQKGGTVPTPATTPTTTPQQPTATASNTSIKTATSATSVTAATTTAKPTFADVMKRGEQIYMTTCAVCHQPTGEGMPPTFPALKGDKIVTGPVDEHINRVLNGKAGTAMQAFRDQLTDEDIAAVITFERNSWGNKSDSVQANQVKIDRDKPPLPN